MTWMLREQHRTSFRRLVRALAGSSSGFRFLVATFGDSEYRNGLIAHLDQEISRTDVTIAIEPEGGPRAFEEQLARAAETVDLVHIVGFEALGQRREEWFNRLNYAREDLANNCPAAVILWLHDDEATALAEQAPDLWAWRKGIYEFTWLVGSDSGLEDEDEWPKPVYPSEERVLEELIRVFGDREPAELLTRRGGISRSRMPLFSAPEAFWAKVAADARAGMPSGGMQRIIEAASQMYPSNRVFAEYLLTRHDEDSAGREGQDQQVLTNEGISQEPSFAENQTMDAVARARMGGLHQHFSGRDDIPVSTRLALTRELGEQLLMIHNYVDAMDTFRAALDLARESGDQYAAGQISASIGRTFEAQGAVAAAQDMFREASTIFERIGDLRNRNIAMTEVARILCWRGLFDEAFETYRGLLPEFVASGDLREQAIVLAGMARVHGLKGDLEEALRLFGEAGQRFEALGERRMHAINLGEVARIHWERGELEKALEIHEEQRREFVDLGETREEAVVLGDIARILRSRGEVDRPMALDRERLEINRAIGNKMGVANAQWAIGRDLSTRDPEQALECFKESYEICVDLGFTDAIARVGYDYGVLLISTGQSEVARFVLERVLDSLRALGRDDDATEVSALLDGLETGSP